ncbi:MAG: outer membrane beta-barrel protein [Opitutaceae bacterium]|nr:outer membrane beta-barrel protein [Opitutaceae bacterium]
MTVRLLLTKQGTALLLALPSLPMLGSFAAHAADSERTSVDTSRLAGAEGASAPLYATPPTPKLDQSRRFRFLLDSEVRYDNNVYLSKDDRVSDTILLVKPGVSAETSDRSAVKGRIEVRNTFTHAIDDTMDDESLLSANGDISYASSRFKTSFSINYDQTNQNNRDVVVEGRREVFRIDSLLVDSDLEYQFTGKSSGGVGFNYASTSFPDGFLVDSQSWEIPLNYYYAVSPKADVFTGVAFRETTAEGSDAKSRSVYYNAGIRGEITPLLTGRFSVGYRTLKNSYDSPQTTSGDGSEGMLAFQGSMTLSIGSKSSLTLVASRDFKTSAQGESLTSGSYQFVFTNQTGPTWSNSAYLAYSTFEYGDPLFAGDALLRPGREDKYIELGASSTYRWNNWLQSGLSASFRRNESNFDSLEFNSVLISVLVGVQF